MFLCGFIGLIPFLEYFLNFFDSPLPGGCVLVG